jgi:16S rRNA (cytosine967-C5)-methyltransferase
MQISSLIGHAGQCSSIIIKSTKPADTLVSEYTRERKYLGSSDRKILSELVFSYLRNKTVVEYISSTSELLSQCINEQNSKNGNDFKLYLLVTYILFFTHLDDTVPNSIQTFVRFFELNEQDSLRAIESIATIYQSLSNTSNKENVAIFYSVPEWILDKFKTNPLVERSFEDQVELAKSQISAAPLCIRVNTHIATSEDVLQRLQFAGIKATPSRYVPNCIIIHQRISLLDTQLYKSGAIEVQDESSQLAAFAVAPEAEWQILDACAGAGGKSLHLATLQKDMGAIVSSDIEWNRLKQIQKRNERHRFTSISTFLWGQKNKKFPYKEFDAVLIDAPCSGLGTIRRMPLPKWKLTKDSISKLAKNQATILENYSHYVKPNGILVYATCSLLPQENEEVVLSFLKKHLEFQPDSLIPGFNTFGVTLTPDTDFCTTMLPSVHGSDGFFVARLRRNG